jgi:hypothetical protein
MTDHSAKPTAPPPHILQCPHPALSSYVSNLARMRLTSPRTFRSIHTLMEQMYRGRGLRREHRAHVASRQAPSHTHKPTVTQRRGNGKNTSALTPTVPSMEHPPGSSRPHTSPNTYRYLCCCGRGRERARSQRGGCCGAQCEVQVACGGAPAGNHLEVSGLHDPLAKLIPRDVHSLQPTMTGNCARGREHEAWTIKLFAWHR